MDIAEISLFDLTSCGVKDDWRVEERVGSSGAVLSQFGRNHIKRVRIDKEPAAANGAIGCKVRRVTEV